MRVLLIVGIVQCMQLYEHGFELRDDVGGALERYMVSRNAVEKLKPDERCFGADALREKFRGEDIRIPESKQVYAFCAPYFLIIGFGRCGTTSLAKYLSGHPRMSFGTRKEHLYFYRPEFCDLQHGPNDHWPKCDLGAYASQFPLLETSREITFDATPMLGGDMGVPASIHTMGWLQTKLPKLKFIVLVKSPADRFMSNPLATAKVSRLQAALRQKLHNEKEQEINAQLLIPRKLVRLLMDNCYIDKLGAWLKFFSADRFYLVRSEDLRGTVERRQKILDAISTFLGIEAYQYPADLLEYVGHEKRATNESLDPSTRTLINCLPELITCEQRLESAVKSDFPVFNWCQDARDLSDGIDSHVQLVKPTKRAHFIEHRKNMFFLRHREKRRQAILDRLKQHSDSLPRHSNPRPVVVASSSTNTESSPCFQFHTGRYCAPTFLIPGFARSGTTSLAVSLDAHPKLTFGRQKENFFFFRHCNLLQGGPTCGIEAYALNFPVSHNDTQLAFDATPLLGGDSGPKAPSSLVAWYKSKLPFLKFIILMNSPADRLVANARFFPPQQLNRLYNLVAEQNKRNQLQLPAKLEKLLYQHCYINRLEPWLEHFAPDRFLLLPAEPLIRNHNERLQRQRHDILWKILNFLDLADQEEGQLRSKVPSSIASLTTTVYNDVRISNITLQPQVRRALNCIPRMRECEQRLRATFPAARFTLWCK